MGRPINKKYFANTNYQDFGFAGVGGEGVASVAIASPIAASMNTGATATFSAPQLANGQTATGTVTIDGNGDITAVTITSAGSGYTSVPTITITDTVAGGGETATLTSGSGGVTVTLTTTRQNSIKAEVQIGSGGSELLTGDIIKQVGSKRYKVKTSDGTAICKLVTTEAKGSNEMSIMATDSAGGTYLVKKLTARKAILVPVANTHGGSTSAGSQFASGKSAKWTFGSAVLNTTVTIANQ